MLAVPVGLLGTVVHELFHVLAVWVQGGTVTEFQVLPGAGRLGHIRWDGDGVSGSLVSVAPTIGWLLLSLVGLRLVQRARERSVSAKAALVLCWLLPWGDTSLALSRLYLGVPSADLTKAFGPDRAFVLVAAALTYAVAVASTVRLGRRAFGPTALSSSELAAGFVALMALPWFI